MGLSRYGYGLLMLWILVMQSFMLLRLDAQILIFLAPIYCANITIRKPFSKECACDGMFRTAKPELKFRESQVTTKTNQLTNETIEKYH